MQIDAVCKRIFYFETVVIDAKYYWTSLTDIDGVHLSFAYFQIFEIRKH